jgi:pilus assembly protein CpaB
MSRSSGASTGRRTLLFAVVFGLLAAGFAVYAVQLARPTEAAAAELGTVIVIKQPVQARQTLTREMLEERRMPLDARHAQAATSMADVVGKVPRQAMVVGEQVLTTKLFSQRTESGLAFMIPPGKRGVSVEVTEVIGSGGLIIPGDRVDVIGVCKTRYEAPPAAAATPASSQPAQANRDGAAGPRPTSGDIGKAALVLQNITVVAVAQRLEGAQEADLARQATSTRPGTGDDEQPKARSVTLAVAPAEGQRLVLYAEMCNLRLALRAADDNTIVEVRSEELFYDLIRPGTP